jgi:hypothetical protein
LVDCKEAKVEYCSTDEMLADYMTKPLVGGKLRLFQDLIMNLNDKHHRIAQQECVGQNNKELKIKGVKGVKRNWMVLEMLRRSKPKKAAEEGKE